MRATLAILLLTTAASADPIHHSEPIAVTGVMGSIVNFRPKLVNCRPSPVHRVNVIHRYTPILSRPVFRPKPRKDDCAAPGGDKAVAEGYGGREGGGSWPDHVGAEVYGTAAGSLLTGSHDGSGGGSLAAPPDSPPLTPTTPVPSPVVGAGLPGLALGIALLALLGRYRLMPDRLLRFRLALCQKSDV